MTTHNRFAGGKTGWFYRLALVLLCAVAYSTSFQGVFVFDDLLRLPRYLNMPNLLAAIVGSTRPLTDLTFYMNVRMAGLQPVSFHIVNFCIHFFAALLLFGIVNRSLRSPRLRERYGDHATVLAFSIAGLWAVHPLQTESVTYVIQRAQSLMGMFFLLTLYCVVRGAASSTPRKWFAAAITACFLGMGSKPEMVMAPLVVLLHDCFCLAQHPREIWVRRRGLYVGLAASTLLLLVILSLPNESSDSTGLGAHTPTVLEYCLTQPGVILHYLKLAVVPYPQCFDYAWAPVAHWTEAVLPATALGVGIVAVIVASLRLHLAGYCGLWVLLILAPTSSCIPVTDCAVEHRMYLALAGVVALCVGGVYRFCLGPFKASDVMPRHHLKTAICVLVMTFGVLMCLTVARNRSYRSAELVWIDVISKRPDNNRAYVALATAYMAESELARSEVVLRELLSKLSYFEMLEPCAIPVSGNGVRQLDLFLNARYYAHARNVLGIVLTKRGAFSDAIVQFEEALRLFSTFDSARENLKRAKLDLKRLAEPH